MSTPDPATTEWVPLWSLDGGVDLRYRGAWAAGSYTDGDIVVYQGVSYMCVRPTSAPPVAWPPSVQVAPSYGTSLPASPVNGQEHVLVDSVSNPSYQWRFRYNVQSSSPYKWEFVGGAAALSVVDASQATTSTVYVDVATPGPSFTLPRAGDYMVGFGARMYVTIDPPNTGLQCLVGLLISGLTTAEVDWWTGQGANWGISPAPHNSRQIRVNGQPAGALAILKYKVNLGSGNFQFRWLSIHPVRVA